MKTLDILAGMSAVALLLGAVLLLTLHRLARKPAEPSPTAAPEPEPIPTVP